MIIRKQRSIAEVADIIHGNINHDELYIHLMMNAEAFEEQMKIEIREENERAAREALINEQQMAYEESLLADRLKEEERLRKEQHEASEREKMESERLRSEAKKEAERQEAANSLPQEPASDCKDPISKIRFRTPKGDFIERRFLAENELKVIFMSFKFKKNPIIFKIYFRFCSTTRRPMDIHQMNSKSLQAIHEEM